MEGEQISKDELERLLPLDDGQKPMRLVTIRAMAIACSLMPLLAVWVYLSEVVWYSGHSTTVSLFYHVTFTVLVIALLNLLVRYKWPSMALSPGELLTIYMMLSIASTFCSHDTFQILIPMLAYPTSAANDQNRWNELVLAHIPSWAIVSNKSVCDQIVTGNSSIYSWEIIKAWLGPLGFWFMFALALVGALLCLNIFFRQPWTEKERLSFPIIQIPMAIATNLSGLLRNRLFQIAFFIAGLIGVVNGFHHFYPNIPEIPIVNAFKFSDYFVERPWNAIAGVTVNLYPFAIGLAFFLPVDLAFSCWFFFVVFQLQYILASAMGVTDLPGFPYTGEQTAGGYMALGLIAIWLARKHFAAVVRTILGRPGGADESNEPVRYRTALLFLVICVSALLYFGTLLGASWKAITIFFFIFFLYSLAIARMRAELGPPAHDLHYLGPEILMHNAVGTRGLGESNMGGFSMLWWITRAYRGHFSPHSMEGFKLAQLAKITSRSMMIAMLVAIVVGIISAFWAGLHIYSVYGMSGNVGSWFSYETNSRLANLLSSPEEPSLPATIATAGGLLFSLFLGFMRMKFTWWLWHPVGFATSASWSMSKLWFCIFLGWLVKNLITRYGGAAAYRKALPFFIG
ncbi:MAG: DUF6785 family protein, partial [bacterium]